MSLSSFTYTGSEALEMIKTTFPKSWENEINEGYVFLKALMRTSKLPPMDALQRYMKTCGRPVNAICLLATLHVMIEQSKLSPEIKKLQADQLVYGNQLIALEASQTISTEEKQTLRGYYISKQNELQQRINELIFGYPVIGAEKIIVQTTLFD